MEGPSALTDLFNLLKDICNKGDLDFCMIRMLKRAISNFLGIYPDTQLVHGKPLSMLVMGEESCTISKFNVNVVLGEYEDARNLICIILPLILQIDISIYIVDFSAESKNLYVEQKCPSRCDELPKLFDNSKLNFTGNSINLLLNPGHYDIIYDEKVVKEHPLLSKYYRIEDYKDYKDPFYIEKVEKEPQKAKAPKQENQKSSAKEDPERQQSYSSREYVSNENPQYAEYNIPSSNSIIMACCSTKYNRSDAFNYYAHLIMDKGKTLKNIKCPHCQKKLSPQFIKESGLENLKDVVLKVKKGKKDCVLL